jgi:hypothetical protein
MTRIVAGRAAEFVLDRLPLPAAATGRAGPR